MLVPGQAKRWAIFNASQSLEELRELLASLKPGHGVELQGEDGLTSHIADVIRRANVPARMKPRGSKAA